MSSCCSGNSSSVQDCPQCGIPGKNISMRTVFHQVRFPETIEIKEANYHYCAEKTCAIGYFCQQGFTIPQEQLKVFGKHQNNKLCYCFDVSTEQYINALKENIADRIKSFVIQKTKSGDCACEITNPSGQCCLAGFKQLEKKLNVVMGKLKKL